jgi:hypothetical protein
MVKPIIKQHRSHNQYVLTKSGYWVRDFSQKAKPLDINKFTQQNEQQMLTGNETVILSKKIPEIGSDHLPTYRKGVVVSNGFQFNAIKEVLDQLPRDVCIIGVNRSLANWNLSEIGLPHRKMDYYFVNNPYNDCLGFIPEHSYYPRCICSLRTNSQFIEKYSGMLFYYTPTPDVSWGKRQAGVRPMDDYRNPICGAISLLARCNVKKLALVCCDDAFEDQRPASEQLPNGLWMYPQHHITHELIDGMLYWLTSPENTDVKVVDISSGPEYRHAIYIGIDKLLDFFNNDE